MLVEEKDGLGSPEDETRAADEVDGVEEKEVEAFGEEKEVESVAASTSSSAERGAPTDDEEVDATAGLHTAAVSVIHWA
jgi:hypothetical protein